jgi:RIO kinase 1
VLKEVDLPLLEDWQLMYIRVIELLRKLYQLCKLVHADFSEYNLLYYKNEIYVIDVSQAVEHDHPLALEFLRRDCANVNIFFEKKGVSTLSLKEAFYIVIEADTPVNTAYIQDLIAKRKTMPATETQLDDALFKNLSIPRSLFDVDIERLQSATPDQLVTVIYKHV